MLTVRFISFFFPFFYSWYQADTQKDSLTLNHHKQVESDLQLLCEMSSLLVPSHASTLKLGCRCPNVAADAVVLSFAEGC